MTVRILRGDVRDRLRDLPDESVHCVVTSPPYWGLRDYGMAGQLGLEETPQGFVDAMVGVFRDVRRVLRSDGTLWLNLGDSYTGSGKGGNPEAGKRATNKGSQTIGTLYGKTGESAREAAVTNVSRRLCAEQGFLPKNLVGIPWRVALALQMDGWYLRQDIIWAKPNPMPESVTDRCTKAHEYIFLLSKSERYHYDADAIAEPLAESSVERLSQPTLDQQKGSDRVPGDRWNENNGRGFIPGGTRNKRSVWEITTKGYPGAHFATFPPELPELCILAGCPVGGTVLDPFGGAGTTGLVADRLQRDAILIELNPEYADMAERRIRGDSPLFAQVGT